MDTGDKPRETPAGAPGAADCPLQTDGPSPWPLSAAPAQLPDTPPFGDPPARAAEPRADSTASGPPGAAVEVPARAQASGLGTGEPSPAQSKLNKWITDRISPARPSSSSSSFSLSGWTPPVERHFTPLRGPHGKFISPPQRAPSTASSPGSPADSAQRHARGERSHSDIAELAKHEAEIEHRTAALKREGFWSLKRLSRVAEPSRPKVHWDYLCEEMQWLSADFAQERRWKRGVARKVVRMVMRHHEELRQKEERARREEQAKLRRIASSIAKEVRAFWSSVEKVVQFKQQSRLEEKRKKALDLQLDFIVGQTEKYSDLLSQSLSEAPAGSVLLPRHGAPVRPAPEEDGNLPLLSPDGDFEPQCEEEDDEETIEVEEQQEGNDAEAQRREIELLRQEGELPLDQLLQTLRAQTEAQVGDGEWQELHGSVWETVGDGGWQELRGSVQAVPSGCSLIMVTGTTSRAPEEDEDDEFAANEDEAEDEEDTIAAQEVVEGDADHSQELSDLAREGSEMSIEELMERYSGAYAEDFEVPSASESSSSSEEEQEEADEESVNTGEREEEDQSEAAEGDQSEEEESHCSDSSAALDSDDGRSSPGGDVGVAFLLKGDRSPPTPGEKVPIAPRPKKEISDIAATAESLQPKGYTLATTQVKTPIPFLLYGTLREYQHIGLDWLVTMYEKKLNGILADEMGLGKTIQTISLLAHLACEKGTESLGYYSSLTLSQRRLLLTGTPLQNSLMELWSLMHFLMPHVFQSHREFREWFSNPLTGMIEGSQEYNEGLVKRLHKVLRPFLLRRIKADVEKQMPKKYEHVVRCRLSKRQRFLYDDFMAQASTRETLASGHFMSVINILMQLRKVCNHPNLFDPRPIHSPFITPRILYTTALRPLSLSPLQRCDLSMFDLIGLEGRVTRYQADVFLPRRKVSRLLVQEVMDSPDPPPRPKPVRMKVNRMFQPLPKADGRTVVLVNSPRPPGPAPSPAPSPSPLLRPPVAPESAPVAAAPLPQQQHPAPPVTVCSVPPAALARPPLVPAGPTLSLAGEVLSIAQLASLASRPVQSSQGSKPVTFQLQGNKLTLSGAQLHQVNMSQPRPVQDPLARILNARCCRVCVRVRVRVSGIRVSVSLPARAPLQCRELCVVVMSSVTRSVPVSAGNVVHLVSSGGQHHLISQPAQVAVIQTVSQSSAGVVSTHQPTLPPGPPGLSLPLNATQALLRCVTLKTEAKTAGLADTVAAADEIWNDSADVQAFPSSMVSGSGIVKIVVRQSAGKEGVPTLAVPPTPRARGCCRALPPGQSRVRSAAVSRGAEPPPAGTGLLLAASVMPLPPSQTCVLTAVPLSPCPLAARLSATPGRDDSDVITLRVATPSGASPHLGGGLSTPRVRTQVPPPPRSPFYMPPSVQGLTLLQASCEDPSQLIPSLISGRAGRWQDLAPTRARSGASCSSHTAAAPAVCSKSLADVQAAISKRRPFLYRELFFPARVGSSATTSSLPLAVRVPCVSRACPVRVPCVSRACPVRVPCVSRACPVRVPCEPAVEQQGCPSTVQLPFVTRLARVVPLHEFEKVRANAMSVLNVFSGDPAPTMSTMGVTEPGPALISTCVPALFFQSWLADRRKAQREARLSRILRVNEQHCSARPIYGQEVLRFLTVLDRPSAPSPDAPGHWLSSGYAHCLNAQSQAPDRYWERSEALSRVIQTPEQRIEQLSNVIDRFIFVIPPVEAPAVALHTSHPPPWLAHREAVFRERLRAELSPRTACLHRVHCNMRTQFPDLRLIQYDCGKLQTLHMLLRRLKAGGHRVLIFTQMTRMLDVLEQFLNYHGHIYLRLDGSTRVEQRQALMERFNADRRIFCFILSTRSGGVGVNLTGADTVVFYDSDWNPTMDAQAQDRCHRIGQTRDVHIYRLISERTVEENILKKANQKRMLGDMAIEGGNFTTAFFKQQTIRELFDLTEGERKEMEQPNQAPSRQEEEEALNNKHTSILEQALCRAEDEEDIAAASQAKAEQVAELAEFNENIPLEEGSEGAGREQEEEELSKAEQEIAALVEQLTPIERYAMNFLEASLEDVCKEELKQAEAWQLSSWGARADAVGLSEFLSRGEQTRLRPVFKTLEGRAGVTRRGSGTAISKCSRGSLRGGCCLGCFTASQSRRAVMRSTYRPRRRNRTLARPEPEAGARTEDNMPVQEASTACVSAPAPSLAPTLASASANPNPTPAPAPAPAPAQTLASASANPNPTPTPAPAPVQAPLVPAPEEDSTPQHRDVPEPAGLALQGDTKDELHLPSPPPLTRLATPEAHQLPEPAEPAPPSPQNNLLPDAGVGQPEGGGGGLPSPGPSSPPQPAACQAPRDPHNADEAGQSSSPGHRAAELGTPPPQPPPASPLPSPGSSPPGSPPLPQAPARSPRKRVSADGEVLNSLQEGSPSAKVLRKLPGRLVTVVEEKELKRRRRGASG
uniref:Snf2 related CREBBP activator protein n=1 Tax=Lepisosteus oculatus TaxID=7918 RepID=W5M6I9_LEPOC